MKGFRAAICIAAVLAARAATATVAAVERFAAAPASVVPVTLDGRVNAAEWRDAAVLRTIRAAGGSAVSKLSPTFFLKHDREALWVAVICPVNAAALNYRSQVAPAPDDGDAVEVILGSGEGAVGDTVAVGGYEGAIGGRLSPVAHAYTFNVTRGGRLTRSYDESPLNRPRFEAKCAEGPGQWTCEMRIPLASAGLPTGDGWACHANFVRRHQQGPLFWCAPPGLSPYVPMRFGRLTLLRPEDAAERTLEVLSQVATGAQTPPPAQSDRLECFSLAKAVVATVDPEGLPVGGTVRLCAAGVEASGDTSTVQRDGWLRLSLPASTRGPVDATLEVLNQNGKPLRQVVERFEVHPAPDWYGTQAGIEYLDRRISKPWSWPAVEGQSVQLVHATIRYSGAGLPAAITHDVGDLLTGGTRLHLSVAGELRMLEPADLGFAKEGTGVTVEATQRFEGGEVQTRVHVDFDGFMVVKLRVRGVRAALIDRLQVDIPIRGETARFITRGLVQDIQPLTSADLRLGAGYTWVGSEDQGLAFSFDTPPFLGADPAAALELIRDGETRRLRINLVDGPGQVPAEGHIFRFFLHPTPTKRMDRRPLVPRYSLWFEQWSDYQGYPDLAKMPRVKQKAEQANAAGVAQLLYFNQMLAENAPSFATFRNEFETRPSRQWYQRGYDPGKGVPCYVCNVRGPYGDLLLDGIGKLANEGGISGVYMDGTSVAWSCDHPLYGDAVSERDRQWDRPWPSRIIGVRRFLKRLRGVFDQTGRPIVLYAHTGGALDINTLSLCDGFLEGEQLSRYLPGYRIPLSTWAVGYSGFAWGFRSVFHSRHWRRSRGWNRTVR